MDERAQELSDIRELLTQIEGRLAHMDQLAATSDKRWAVIEQNIAMGARFIPPTEEERQGQEKEVQWWSEAAAAAVAGLTANSSLTLSDSELAARATAIANLMVKEKAGRERHWMQGAESPQP